MKTYVVNQKELTPDCWKIQIMGFVACKDCEYLNTPECGGKETRRQILKGAKKPIGKEI